MNDPDEHEVHGENPLVANLPPGSFAFHYELRTKPGKADEFLRTFHEWDYSDQNIVHRTPGMVHEDVKRRSVERYRAESAKLRAPAEAQLGMPVIGRPIRTGDASS